MSKQTPKPIKRIAKRLLFPTPPHLLKNHIQIDGNGLAAIEKSIRENYFTEWRSESKYPKERFENDLKELLSERLKNNRRQIIPWIDSVSALQDKRILEIGCGTGASTVALAEQGAKVTGIDIDEGALSVAKERCLVYGIKAEFQALSATAIFKAFDANAFDFVIFFACLEHMTISERLISLRDAWEMLPNEGLLIIVGTPNRLWYFDGHTSNLPFFHWLPNKLAFKYSSFSSRENFSELYRDYNANSKEHFLRRGRGLSYHEFDIAIGPTSNLNVTSSLSQFLGIWYRLNRSKLARQYKSLLMSIYPSIHEGFFEEFLNLIIKKS